jgi:hypothetical protein
LVDVRYNNPNNNPNDSDNDSVDLDPISLAKSIDFRPEYEANLPAWERDSRAAAQKALNNGNLGYTRRFDGFDKDLRRMFEFTTEISIVPNTFPYADCSGESCGVRLV